MRGISPSQILIVFDPFPFHLYVDILIQAASKSGVHHLYAAAYSQNRYLPVGGQFGKQ